MSPATHAAPSASTELSASCPDFQGRRELINRINAAVDGAQTTPVAGDAADGDVSVCCREIQSTLEDMIGGQRLKLPTELTRADSAGYARRLLHKCPERGYAVVAMIWGPNQATALHDHDGVWCVEGVIQGTIAVTSYELVDDAGERCRFMPQQTVHAGVGSAGSLIPPFEYHTIANHLDDGASVTLHVYGHELQKAHIFEPESDGEGWYRRTVRHLGYSH